MSDCKHGNMTAHGNECPWCKVEQLEAELSTTQSAYGDLLVDSAVEVHNLEAAIEQVKALPDKWRKAFDYESESGEPLDAIKRGVNKCSDDLVAALEEQEDE